MNKEVGEVLSDLDSVFTVVNHVVWVPAERVLLWVPLCPIDRVLEG